ncbi:sulfurtransferase TusA family protein [Herbivorax sp. ANBcel31]|uniref:sulfurtransferase TusA family protein n=1 Tax=Herbivorax sp. ANBcel31 TaxID=3069754 RepID=UPI0027B18BED|nr:sulfurtransferase TusA family protein [Herbivorax sp. ANBcel31]MDQ2087246.1 sulfurtransferase TusA family protein [Herbivorax sp. ANBcel31]
MKTIDTCGMSCPQPVLMTKKALDVEKEGVDVIVDNNTAKENVQRFIENAGYLVEIEEKDGTFVLKARK